VLGFLAQLRVYFEQLLQYLDRFLRAETLKETGRSRFGRSFSSRHG
jgi:hypothetical protein